MIENGKKVKIHYTGTLADGTRFDSSKGLDPFEFEIGSAMVIPGFNSAVKTMEVGEVKTVTIPAAEAYGEPKAELIKDVPKTQLPADMTVEVGLQLTMQTPSGQTVPVRIAEIKEETVAIDANHEFAGKDLTFELELVEVV